MYCFKRCPKWNMYCFKCKGIWKYINLWIIYILKIYIKKCTRRQSGHSLEELILAVSLGLCDLGCDLFVWNAVDFVLCSDESFLVKFMSKHPKMIQTSAKASKCTPVCLNESLWVQKYPHECKHVQKLRKSSRHFGKSCKHIEKFPEISKNGKN